MSQLVRGLGLTGAASVNIANMIGTGVFLKARVMTCNVDTPGAVLLVWVLAGFLVVAGALSYAELAAMLPKAGGEYVFLRTCYGRLAGFLYGWTSILVSRTAAHAAQAVSTAIFLNIVTGGKLLEGKLGLVSVAMVFLMTFLNFAKVSSTGVIMSVFTAVKVTLVLGVGAAAFLLADGNWMNYAMSNEAGTCAGVAGQARGGLAGFGAAMLGALWGYQGWANLTPMVGEIRDPGRNIPRAFLIATLVVASVYVFANASYFFALTPTEIASVPLSSSVATEALRKFLGDSAVRAVAACLTVSSLGALYAGITTTMRIPYAMATDGLFFRWFAELSPATSVPIRAALLTGTWISLLALSGNYDRLTDYAVFALCIFYVLNATAVLLLRRKMPDAERPYRVTGYPVLTILFILLMSAILLNTLVTATVQSLIGLSFIALGIPFYRYWASRTPEKQS
ncbi:MAG: amino acid permease [Bryobacterales bacterium]|nr:amino acid permease [Bryobacterales bacterium]